MSVFVTRCSAVKSLRFAMFVNCDFISFCLIKRRNKHFIRAHHWSWIMILFSVIVHAVSMKPFTCSRCWKQIFPVQQRFNHLVMNAFPATGYYSYLIWFTCIEYDIEFLNSNLCIQILKMRLKNLNIVLSSCSNIRSCLIDCVLINCWYFHEIHLKQKILSFFLSIDALVSLGDADKNC